MGVGRLGPALAHFESGQLKPELNARLHYAGIDRATFESQVNAAQEIILKELAHFQAEAGRVDSSSKFQPELNRRLAPVTTTQELTTATRNRNNNESERLLSPYIESVSAAAQAENIFYGTGFCPYAEMLKALTRALLQDYARLPNFYRTSSSQLEQLSYNSLVYLCAYLTVACCGTRKSELILTTCSSIDLQHHPPLITLNGKRDLFNTEPRTIPLPQRLKRLWEVVLHIRNLLKSNTFQQAESESGQSLYIFPEPSYTARNTNTHLRKSHREGAPELVPLTAPQLWHFLEKAAIRLQLRDFLFRFQSFRQNLWFFLKQRGAPEEVVEYLLGHQSTGAEILHPFTGRPLQPLYHQVLPHLDALLDELGVSNEVVTALINRDYQGLSNLLPHPVEEPFYDDWLIQVREEEAIVSEPENEVGITEANSYLE